MSKFITKDYMLLALALIASVLLPDMAMAAADPISDALCIVVSTITGGIGGAIATLAVIIIGVGALMGKVSWGMAIIVVLGIAIVFGATALVTAEAHVPMMTGTLLTSMSLRVSLATATHATPWVCGSKITRPMRATLPPKTSRTMCGRRWQEAA